MKYSIILKNSLIFTVEQTKMKRLIIVFLLVSFFFGCTSAHHQQKLQSTKEREFTVGLVQKEIIVGMSQTEVAEALGSPNILTRDKDGKESWIYDKIASEASYSKSSVGAAGGAGGITGNTLILGIITGGYESGASSTTQKTLTVVIKFNDDKLVESFSYHSSKF
jgi:outer membrane protein assembly factor BamE (lipoprotein component of BamABCDE complex)